MKGITNASPKHSHIASDINDITATAQELNLLNGKTSDNLRKITAGTTDLIAGTSVLATDEIYCVYEA